MAVAKEYIGFKKVSGPIMYVENIANVGFGEVVQITDVHGRVRHGRVLSVGRTSAAVEIFEGTGGMAIAGTRIRFLGHPVNVPVSKNMLGRVFNGLGEAIDGLPEPIVHERRNVNGSPINPTSRAYPRDFIQTGISTIDGMNTLIRGQKLPIFSGSGLPHNKLAAQIVRQATIRGEETQFAIVFGAMGIKHDDAAVFRQSFEETGVLKNVVMFMNLANDPSIERLMTPRSALTVAEYLAFDCGMHVLVILTDMTNYCEALREVATSKGEVPSRKGYPGYLYSDLASIYERAGRIVGRKGSITQIPILTMPNDDVTHPIPDLTGYITEGQIVLDRNLDKRGIYPPINVLPSLSRLMNSGIGEGRTREDHRNISNQLYSAYTYVKRVEMLASIIGENELSELDKKFLELGHQYELTFVKQGMSENRTIEETLNLAWKIVSGLPRRELTRVNDKQIARYLN